jgi:hypothetical protein
LSHSIEIVPSPSVLTVSLPRASFCTSPVRMSPLFSWILSTLPCCASAVTGIATSASMHPAARTTPVAARRKAIT